MSHRIIFWSGVLIIVFILGGLWWWYTLLQKQTRNIQTTSNARGFSSISPTFSGSGGSTRENISGIFQTTFGAPSVTLATSTKIESLPRLFKASTVPSTGLYSFLLSGTSGEEFRFVERPSGNILAVSIAGGVVRRITNTLIPQVYDALWIKENTVLIRHSNDGGITLLSFLGTIQTATSSATSALVGTYLEDIVAAAARPSRKEPALFYLALTESGVVGILANSDGSKPRRVWSSPLSGWGLSWLSDNNIIIYQKASEGVIGSAYSFSPTTGALSLLVGNKEGLSIKHHPSKNAFLYSTSLNGSIKMYARVDGTDVELPLSTFAEKCVWSPENTLKAYCATPTSRPRDPLPDAWYRGEVHFVDQWYSIDPVTGSVALLTDMEQEFGNSIDVIDPLISSSLKYLLFTDKTTGSPWVLTL